MAAIFVGKNPEITWVNSALLKVAILQGIVRNVECRFLKKRLNESLFFVNIKKIDTNSVFDNDRPRNQK